MNTLVSYTLTPEELAVLHTGIAGALARNGHLFQDDNTPGEREHLAKQRELLKAAEAVLLLVCKVKVHE